MTAKGKKIAKKEPIIEPVVETADDVRARVKAHQKSLRIRRG
jgi:hypothetical protein